MHLRSRRPSRRSGLVAALLLLACDPPPGTGEGAAGHGKGAGEAGRDPIADGSLGEATVTILEDGTILVYDRYGDLRAKILDPRARFTETIEPIAGTKEWAKPSPQLTIPLGGLATWLTKRGQERRAKAQLEAKGLTDSQRMMVAIAEQAEATETQLAALDRELAALWADASKPAAERRRLIFARWDECEEGDGAVETLEITDASTAADAIRAQAGERARATIESFVRKALPARGADAFTAEELAGLNAERSSKRAFAPYEPRPPTPPAAPAPAPGSGGTPPPSPSPAP
ncbi:MAG: hypothetical protein H6712_19540 [Myxococcales bacterium]|nr:hypothetical protein [Myxococcales bacterium]